MRSTQCLDLRETWHLDVLDRIELVLGTTIDRDHPVFGDDGATCGFRSHRQTWVRLQHTAIDRGSVSTSSAVQAAAGFHGVKKPAWRRGTSWFDDGRRVRWRVDEMDYMGSPVLDVFSGAAMPPAWWQTLRESLRSLRSYATDRVALSQETITSRIQSTFPGVDTVVDEWVTAHADLHWGNLTEDGHVLDWEDWGMAPRGYDATLLWGASLRNAAVARRVEVELADDLQCRSGRIARLMFCCRILELAQVRAELGDLASAAASTARTLQGSLRRKQPA